jgi:signal transduction histidine kinase/ActR/RegA family two-component response regulator
LEPTPAPAHHPSRLLDLLLRGYELTAALSAAHTPDEVVAIVFDKGLAALDADAAVLVLPDAEGTLRVARAEGAPREEAEHRGRVAIASSSPFTDVARSRVPVWLERREEAAARYPAWTKRMTSLPDQAWAALPLVADGELLGVLGLAFRDEGRLRPEDRARLLSVSQKCALAFERSRLFVREREARALAEQTAEALRRANEELEAAAREKDGFLAMLAHELRNPLAGISNAARVIRLRAARGEDLERPLAMLDRQIRNGARLLDDLLDVSRLTRGLVDIRREPVRLDAVVASAVESQRALLDAAGHQLALELPDAPVVVSGDPTRLEQVVANLVHNAAKYTPERGHVRVTLAREGDDAVVTVADDGAGIAPELLPRIFELFVQGETGLARSRGGLGLGLTLVKRLVELHGGTVTARSDGPRRGATFTVRLRAEVAEEGARAAAPALAHGRARGVRARVLVVEDNVDMAALLAEYLRRLGHDVRVANDGVGAMATLSAFTPDVALLDVGLPGMDGYELAGRLRARLGDGALLVAVTGYGQESDRRRALAAGFARHLTKPVEPEQLAAVVASAAGGRRRPPAA